MSGIMTVLVGSKSQIYSGSATVTVGYYSSTNNNYGYINTLGSPPGSITPATWANSALPFYFLYWSSQPFLSFVVTGFAINGGWNTMTIAGTSFNRADATYSYDGTRTSWTWASAFAPTNPFGTVTGATKGVVWA
jgi:hypothetical protein